MRPPRLERRPEPVGAARVQQHPFRAGDEQRQERPRRVVHAPPVDRENTLPPLARVVGEADALPDARAGEDQVHVLAPVRSGLRRERLLAKPRHLTLIRHVARMSGHPNATGRLVQRKLPRERLGPVSENPPLFQTRFSDTFDDFRGPSR